MGTPSGSWRPPTPTAASWGLDADQAAIERVGKRLERFGDRLVLRRSNFRELATVAPAAGFGAVDGMLFDLGLSSFQLADRARGFGFRAGGPLDMRFDATRGVPASELLATLSADELAALFRKYGEEPSAWKDAKAIVAARATPPIESAEDLAVAHRAAVPPNPRAAAGPTRPRASSRRCGSRSTRSSTRSRTGSRRRWTSCGRAAASSSCPTTRWRTGSSSGSSTRSGAGCVCPPEAPVCVCGHEPRLRLVTRPSMTPTDAEVDANPRARSARLRAAERLAA